MSLQSGAGLRELSSLVQDYFLETLEERDYFGRKATFTALFYVEGSKVFSTHAHGIFPPLSANALTAFSSDYGALKENRLEPD